MKEAPPTSLWEREALLRRCPWYILGSWCVCLASVSSCSDTDRAAVVQSQPPPAPLESERQSASIPAGTPLAAFHDATPYSTWSHVTVKSNSVVHERRIYFHKGSRVFVSDTLDESGRVGVIEVIELSPPGTQAPEALAQFLLFDPVTGQSRKDYPDSIQFPITGAGTSRMWELPELCLHCHMSSKPLIRVHQSTPTTEKSFQTLRDQGHGMAYRIQTAEQIEGSPNGGGIRALNAVMDEYPDLLFDVLAP